MDNLVTDDLLTFAATFDGQELRTVARGAFFSVRAFPDSLMITPDSSSRPRSVPRAVIDRVCAKYNESGSLTPSDYLSLTFDASYLLAIIGLMEKANGE